jgi:hypothetical protein
MFRSGCGPNLERYVQLLTSDAVVPFKKLIETAAVIQMIKESLYRNSGFPKHKGAAHHFGVLREHLGQLGECIHRDKMPPTGGEVNAQFGRFFNS